MLKDLTPPNHVPEEKSLQEKMLKLFESSAEKAHEKMDKLIDSRVDQVAFNASKYILDKVTPEKYGDPFAFLSSRSKEELIGIILGSKVVNAELAKIVDGEVVESKPGTTSGAGEGNASTPGEVGEEKP